MDLGILELTEEQSMIVEQVKQFAQKEIAPKAAEIDQNGRFPTEIVKQMAEMGLMGINVEPEYDGAGLDYLTYALVGEEINAACASTGGGGSAPAMGSQEQLVWVRTDGQSGKSNPALADQFAQDRAACMPGGAADNAALQAAAPCMQQRGYVLVPADGTQIPALLKAADAAMYAGKQRGKGIAVRAA